MNSSFEKVAMRVAVVTIIWNLILSAFKFIAGIVAHSGAMVSDAVHSASDVLSSFIVMIGVKISGKESDPEHPYGHERMECVAAIILATILAGTGLGIGAGAVKILANHTYNTVTPGLIALAAAIISIIVKEAMFWYTRHFARQIDSGALMADAWHHRSDALSSVGALIGIGGARLGFHILEPIASIVICVFIEKAAIDIFRDSIEKMVDRSCDKKTEDEIRACALTVDGVNQVDMLRTRLFGNKMYVDMEIAADGNQTLHAAHAIAEEVHNAIEHLYFLYNVKHIQNNFLVL